MDIIYCILGSRTDSGQRSSWKVQPRCSMMHPTCYHRAEKQTVVLAESLDCALPQARLFLDVMIVKCMV